MGCRPAFAVRVSHGELDQAARVTGADEQDVARARPHALLALRRLEVFAEHVLAGLEPAKPRARGTSSRTPRPTSPS